MVVCNLYPFTSTIAKPGCTLADAVEEIDIGGVTLLRAAAKNHERVSVLSDPADYTEFLEAWKAGNGDVGQTIRSKLALKAFEMTAKYDDAISGYFREQYASSDLPTDKLAGPVQRTPLRYGANPHQKPAQAYVTEGELPFKGTLLDARFRGIPERNIAQHCVALLVTSTCSMHSTPTHSLRSCLKPLAYLQPHRSSTFPLQELLLVLSLTMSRRRYMEWMT